MIKGLFTASAVAVMALVGSVATRTAIEEPAVAAKWAARLGITPEAAAACGMSASEVAGVLSRIDGQAEVLAAIEAASSALDNQIALLADANSRLDTDDQDSSASADRAAALAAIQTHTAAVSSAQASLLEAAMASMSSPKVSKLERFRANAGSSLPPALKVFSGEANSVRALEAAMSTERRCQQSGAVVPSAAASLLSEARGNADVQAAAAALEQDLPEIRAVFASWDHP